MTIVCGINGATGSGALAAVQAANAAQWYRGPDDEGIYEDPAGRIVLGARRLSIIDVEHGHQPMCNEDQTVWVVLNGEIYNSSALRDRLLSRGHVLRTRADTETLVHLYEDYGDDFVHALEGMFAFAVWDERRGRLLLVRDRFGEKPLFVRNTAAGFSFASELTALTASDVRTPELDLDMLDAYFVLGYPPGPRTMVRGIEQLRPGHLLTWDSATGKSSTRSYWTPQREPVATAEPIDELAAETLRLLKRSVRLTSVSDVPIGVFLSGGLDSTLLTALVQDDAVASIKTFTVGYDVGDVSEITPARRTSAVLGTDHHELVLDAADIEERVPRVLRSLDQPLADPAIVPLHAVSELARKHVTVVIGGEGADELFGGYPRYRWLVRSNQLRRFVPPQFAALGASAVSGAASGGRLARVGNLLEAQPTLERHLDWVTAGRRHLRAELYGPALAAHRSDGALRTLRPHVGGGHDELGADDFMQLDQRQWLPDDVLFKADRAGMMNSLEIRAPYLGHEVAEFANTVRAQAHLSLFGKRLLRKALAEYVPVAEARRRKMAFRVPGRDWLRGPLREQLEHQCTKGTLVQEGFFDRVALRRAVDQHAAGLDRTPVLWPILALGLWVDELHGAS